MGKDGQMASKLRSFKAATGTNKVKTRSSNKGNQAVNTRKRKSYPKMSTTSKASLQEKNAKTRSATASNVQKKKRAKKQIETHHQPHAKEDEYYAEFDEFTNHGRILDNDLSLFDNLTTQITDTEKSWREEWSNKRTQIEEEYGERSRRIKQISTQTQILQERIVPPIMAQAATGRNTKGRNSINPSRIYEWTDFGEHVSNFNPSNNEAIDGASKQRAQNELQVFDKTLRCTTTVASEENETHFVRMSTLDPLSRANLIGKVHYVEGNTDLSLSENIGNHEDEHVYRIMIEVKSTQNLPIPMNAASGNDVLGVVERYCKGMLEEGSRDRDRVCKPLGQLFAYMLQNRTRYGALTSATRTYFICFKDDDESPCKKVYVSDAWFVGQKGYLQAWACLYALSRSSQIYNDDEVEWNLNGDDSYAPDSQDSEDSQQDNQNNNRDDKTSNTSLNENYTGVGKKQGGEKGDSNLSTRSYNLLRSTFIPTVPYGSIKFLHSVGWGRNGFVFRALWERREVAVKQFNIYSPGVMECFLKEKQAYERLQHAQGILIPKILFLAQSKVGVMYIGLQLGKKPNKGDNTVATKLQLVLKKLQDQYGFFHTDISTANCVLVNDGKEERLVAIDLEEYEWKPSNEV